MKEVGKLLVKSGKRVKMTNEEREQMSVYLKGRMAHFGSELLQIARMNTLSQRSNRHLTEEEVSCGTISAIGDLRRKKEAMVRLKAESQVVFDQLRYDIEDPLYTLTLDRAWKGFLLAKGADQSVFGVKPFGWTCMRLVLRELLSEEDEED